MYTVTAFGIPPLSVSSYYYHWESHLCHFLTAVAVTIVALSGQVAVDGNELLPQTRGSVQGIRALSEGA